ncbi:MAG: hypothetical protein CMP28_08550 [Roseibacillus sp.]|nr:hypothetical protein [Roseibacillus sp.]
MFRQDYILREIERMVEFCLRAAGLKKPDVVADFEDFLEEHCELLTGLPLSTLLDTEAQKLVALLYHPDTAKLPQLVSCGAWLCEAADVSLLSGRHEEARRLFLRGAQILGFMTSRHGHENEFAPLHDHLRNLRGRLEDYLFPAAQRAQLEAMLSQALPDSPPPAGR